MTRNAKINPACSRVTQTTCIFTSASANMLTSDLANMFTSDFADMFTSASASMLTNALADMFTSDLANMFNMFPSEVDWGICWPCIRITRHLIRFLFAFLKNKRPNKYC